MGASVGMTQAEARALAYRRLREAGVARFPFPVDGGVPDFQGAEAAAERLRALAVYRRARALQVNVDPAQQPVRVMALRDRKTLFLATPGLRGGFRRIRPEDVPAGEEDAASTLSTWHGYGTEVAVSAVAVDLVVVGSVAVAPDGARAGQGRGAAGREPEPAATPDAPAACGSDPGGSRPRMKQARERAEDPADIEYAALRELGHPPVPVVTTVHASQIIAGLPYDARDTPVDWVVTPDAAIETHTPHPKPQGIDWARFAGRDTAQMPVLDELRRLRWERQTVSDLLAPGLAIVFVGINPGRASASSGHHFAGPGSHFWRLLHEAGFTDRRWAPEEDGDLPALGIGITNVVARASRGEQDLTREEFAAGGAALRARVAACRPALVALLGKQVYRAYAGLPASAPVAWGLQPRQTVPGVREAVAANPSPRSTVPFAERLAQFRDLRRAMES